MYSLEYKTISQTIELVPHDDLPQDCKVSPLRLNHLQLFCIASLAVEILSCLLNRVSQRSDTACYRSKLNDPNFKKSFHPKQLSSTCPLSLRSCNRGMMFLSLLHIAL